MAKKIAAAIVALLLGLTFAFLYVPVLVETWSSTTMPPVNPAVSKFSTAVAGYVAAIIAMWFGVTAPGVNRSVQARTASFASRLVVVPEWLRATVAIAYLLAYFGVAVIAGLVWVTRPGITPDLLQTQAVVAAGLAFAIVTSLFSE